MLLHKPFMAALGVLGYASDQLATLPVFAKPAPADWTREQVREVVLKEAGHYLQDFEWRYKQARDLYEEMAERGLVTRPGANPSVVLDREGNVVPFRQRQLTAEDIDDTSHRLTGYTITANTPAGQFSWAGLHIVYKGVDYTVADGASGTTNKYFTFVYTSTTPYPPLTATTGSATLTATVTKPTLAADDILVFINPATNAAAGTTAGTPIVAASDAHGSLPRILGNASVDTVALGTKVVTSNEINDNAVIAGKLADGAVETTARIADNIVTGNKVIAGTLAPTKLNILSHILI